MLKGAVVTCNAALLQNDTHVLVRRPQCPACGDPGLTRKSQRIVLGDGAATGSLQDGGARAVTPEETFERYRHHVSPVSGVVSSLMPASNMQSGPLRVWVAGHNFALKNDSLYFLQDGLRSNSAGKGMTDAQARTSALCEAIERYSGVYRGDEPAIRATFRELGDLAIHPNDCMLFSDRQFMEREAWNARRSRFQVVPLPFPHDVPVEWSEVQSLTTGRVRYLPTGYLYYGYPLKDDEFYFWADSNGNAAGNSVEEAALQGFLELIERDAVCLWWYNRLSRPAVDLGSLEEPYLKHLDTFYRRHNRLFWVLDLTTDTGIPTFAAISRRVDRPVEDIVMGFGAHLDARVAIMRAITEMNQFMPAVLRDKPGGGTDYGYRDQDALLWWQTATLANQPYLAPALCPPVRVSNLPALATNNLREDLHTCVRIAQHLGIEVFLLDQTRPDIGLNVVKVMAPGLRHFWARFAPGRLYDAPVRMGCLTQSLPETLLNPIPMFI